jgi:hypothetical protein
MMTPEQYRTAVRYHVERALAAERGPDPAEEPRAFLAQILTSCPPPGSLAVAHAEEIVLSLATEMLAARIAESTNLATALMELLTLAERHGCPADASPIEWLEANGHLPATR